MVQDTPVADTQRGTEGNGAWMTTGTSVTRVGSRSSCDEMPDSGCDGAPRPYYDKLHRETDFDFDGFCRP